MNVLHSLDGSSHGPPRSGAPAWASLVIGVLLGGGLGFYLGRATAPMDGGAAGPVSAPAGIPPSASLPADGESPPAQDAGIPEVQVAVPSAPPGNVRRLSVTLDSSLFSSLSAQLEGREADILSAHVGRLLVWWLDARRDVLRGDRLDVAWEPVPGPGEIRIQALRYQSLKLGKTFEAYLWKPPSSAYGRYYSADGQEVEERLVPGPIDDYEQVTELMDLSGRRHHGVDFKCDVGTPVRTPEEAVVSRVNWRTRGNGNCLELRYRRTGATAMFLHLDEVLPDVRPGRKLAAMSEVARSGNTGRSTAPHLHYELHDRAGRLVNPFTYHETQHRRLEGAELESFQRARIGLERLLPQGAPPGASGAGAADTAGASR